VEPAQGVTGLFAADRLLTAFAGIRPWKHFGVEKSATAAEVKLRSELQDLGALLRRAILLWSKV